MKELKIKNENMTPAHGKEKKATIVKLTDRTPLSNKTNKQGHKLLKQAEADGSKKQQDGLKKQRSQKSVLKVYEDPAETGLSAPAPSVVVCHRETQTGPQPQTQTEPPPTQPQPQNQGTDVDRLVTDMCSAEEPSGQYWRQLAEARQLALQEALSENEQLSARVAAAEEEIRLLRDVVQRAEDVMAAVQEWSEDQETNGQDQEAGRQ